MALGDGNYYIKQGNVEAPLTMYLEDSTGYIPDMAGKTARFFIWSKGSPIYDVVRDRAGTIVDAATGKVRMAWEAADTDTPGVFHVEVDLVGADGRRETFPALDAMTLVIQKRNPITP